MKIIKMNGWEEPMKDMICTIREQELKVSRALVCQLITLLFHFIISCLYLLSFFRF